MERSGKTFDITIGALTQLWRKAKKENRFPSEAEIKAAKDLTGFKNLIVDDRSKTISFKKPGIHFDFGGIVPGYAAQRVIDFLKTKNVNIALADASGDIVMRMHPGKMVGQLASTFLKVKVGSGIKNWNLKILRSLPQEMFIVI
jgi:thiamine biosynthesis lipoprotein